MSTPTPSPAPILTLVQSNMLLVMISLALWLVFLFAGFILPKYKTVFLGFAGLLGVVFGFELITLAISEVLGFVIVFFSIYLFYIAIFQGGEKHN